MSKILAIAIFLVAMGWILWQAAAPREPESLNPEFAWALSDEGIDAKMASLPPEHQHTRDPGQVDVVMEISPHFWLQPNEEIFLVTERKAHQSFAHLWIRHIGVRKTQKDRRERLSDFARFKSDNVLVGTAIRPSHGRGGPLSLAISVSPRKRPSIPGSKLKKYEEPILTMVDWTIASQPLQR